MTQSRRTDALSAFVLAAALLTYALAPTLWLAALASAAFVTAAFVRPRLGLAAVLATLPSYFHAPDLAGLALSLPEVALLLTTVGPRHSGRRAGRRTAAGHALRWLGRLAPRGRPAVTSADRIPETQPAAAAHPAARAVLVLLPRREPLSGRPRPAPASRGRSSALPRSWPRWPSVRCWSIRRRWRPRAFGEHWARSPHPTISASTSDGRCPSRSRASSGADAGVASAWR